MSLPKGHEHGSDSLTTCLTCSGMGKGEMPPSILPPMADRRGGPEVVRLEELYLPLTGCNTGSPVPHLGSTVESALVTGLWVPGQKADELAQPLAYCITQESRTCMVSFPGCSI